MLPTADGEFGVTEGTSIVPNMSYQHSASSMEEAATKKRAVQKRYHIDEVLDQFDWYNPYILFTWLSKGVVWALSALTLMSSSFTMGPTCDFGDCPTLGINGTATVEFHLTGRATGWVILSSFMLGTAVGGLLFPVLSDTKGRNRVLYSCIFLTGLSGLLSSFSFEVYSFIAARSVQGVFYMGCVTTSWVLAYESIPMRLRSLSTTVFGLFWALGYCLVALFAYAVNGEWRPLTQLYCSMLLLYSLFLCATSSESFHFMVLHGDRQGVERWMRKANHSARLLGLGGREVNIPFEAIDAKPFTATQGKQKSGGDGNEGVVHLLLTNYIFLLYNVVMTLLFCADTFIYFGLSIYTEELQFDTYWKHAFTGLVEVPAYVVVPYLLTRMGRRPFLCVAHVTTALALITISLIQHPTWALIAWMMGKCAIGSSYVPLYMYGSEIIPTMTRNACLGAFLLIGHIASAFAPLIPTLASISPFLPTITFSAISIIAALVVWVLPETANRELPDHVDDMPISRIASLIVGGKRR